MKEEIAPPAEHGPDYSKKLHISRREFLGEALMSALAVYSVLSRKSFGVEKEKTPEVAYFQALREIRKEALQAKKERLYLYRRKSGHAETFFLGEGAEGFIYPPLELLDSIDELLVGSEQLELIHTHPLEGAQKLLRYGVSQERIRQTAHRTPRPPSLGDILGAPFYQRYLEAKGARATEAVVEPTGVWTYRVDLDHPFIKAAEKSIEDAARLEESLSANMSHQEWEKENAHLFKGEKGIDTKERARRRWQNIEEFDEEARGLITQLDHLTREPFSKFKHEREFLILMDDFGTRLADEFDVTKAARRLQAILQENGVSVEYTPFEEIERQLHEVQEKKYNEATTP